MKYPRTPHWKDIQPFDLKDNKLVLEEKMDGSQVGIKFGPSRELVLFSRGHLLNDGDLQFDLFKQWANFKKPELYQILGNHSIMYEEWLQYLHSVYYDIFPHYFMEYDIYQEDRWLNTESRHQLLKGSGICSVKVIDSMDPNTVSNFKSDNWRNNLSEGILSEIDNSDNMEGIYIKIENETDTICRSKIVRNDFIRTVVTSQHWSKRQMIQNKIIGDLWKLR